MTRGGISKIIGVALLSAVAAGFVGLVGKLVNDVPLRDGMIMAYGAGLLVVVLWAVASRRNPEESDYSETQQPEHSDTDPVVTGAIHAVALWLLRSVLLWPLIPIAIVAHVGTRVLRLPKKARPTMLGTTMFWFDAALVAALNATLLRPSADPAGGRNGGSRRGGG